MNRRSIFWMSLVALVSVTGVCPAQVDSNARIYWIEDDSDGDKTDQGFIDLLTNAGYTLDMSFANMQARELDGAKLETLNRADLIIVSRDSDSRQFDDSAAEILSWNTEIARPILNLNAFYMQANRWHWVPSSDTWHYEAGPMRIMDPNHPVLEGVTTGPDGLVDVVTSQTTFPMGAMDAAGGTVIGTRADNGFVWMAAWDTTQKLSTGYTPSGPRMLFCCGVDEATTGKQPVLPGNGAYNLTEEGSKIFLNAVEFLLGYGLEKAAIPEPSDGVLLSAVSVELSWAPADGTASDNVYLGDDLEAVTNATPTSPEFMGNQIDISYTVDGLAPGKTYYWRIDGVVEGDPDNPLKGDVWSFSTAPLAAYDPSPASEARLISLDPALTWRVGVGVISHLVYFGTNAAAVDNADPTSPQYVAFLQPEINTWQPVTDGSMILESDTRYFWRVDEASVSGLHKGEVWSFETTRAGLGTCTRETWTGIESREVDDLRADPRFPDSPTEVTELTLLDSNGGIGNWQGARIKAWLHVPFTGVYTFKMSSYSHAELWLSTTPGDRTQTQLLVNVPIERLPRNDWSHSSEAVTLEAGQRYYIEALWVTTDYGDHCQVAWEGPGIRDIEVIQGGYLQTFENLWVSGPHPFNGAVDVKQTPALHWKAGTKATQHDVYFGDDETAVAGADTTTPEIYRGRHPLENTTYVPVEAPLEWNKTYYWRIDEVDDANPDSPWKGGVWSFATEDFIVVDNFEDYNDSPPNEIFNKWTDGWDVPTNGSLVAYSDQVVQAGGHYAETKIVHDGSQSMPFFYDNDFKYSEVSMTLGTQRDWTTNGVEALSLWFRGHPASFSSFTEESSSTYTMTARCGNISGQTDELNYVFKQLSGVGSIVAKVESVTNTNNGAKVGVMIRETLEPDSKHAFAFMRADGGVRFNRRDDTGGGTTSSVENGLQFPHWVRLERDLSGNFTAAHSTDGINWVPVDDLADGSWANVQMNADVYIGLALSSNNTEETCEAIFSNIQVTGAVSPQWVSQDVGILSNNPESMYVALANTGGTPVAVYHDDATATQIGIWTEWSVDLKQFSDQGVDLTDVDTISIGFGDKNNLQAGGSGVVYFDDIRLYPPREPEVDPSAVGTDVTGN